MRKIVLFVLFVFLSVDNAMARPTAKITIKAVDEYGKQIKYAQVRASFAIPNKGWFGLADININGSTDENGECVISEGTVGGVGFSVDKDGYYQSGAGYEFKSSSLLLNRWEPWNPTIEVVLKKKRNPVAMFITGGIIKVPKLDEPVGYDLEKGDWVAPYGGGATSDFVFNLHAASRAYTDYECNFSLTFSNEDDGIQEYYFDGKEQSNFKWPFMAPESGYVSKLYKEKSDTPQGNFKTNEKKNVHYLFRVRTKKDTNGKIVSAMYGKISQEFEFGQNGTVLFRYFLNPDGTRNLEEDTQKNLFKKK